MARIETDFENAGKLISKGSYLAEIFAATPKTTKVDGSLMVVVDWVIIEKGEFEGRRVTEWKSLNDQKKNADGTPDKEAIRLGNFYMKQFMDVIKAPYDGKGFDTEDMVHKKAIIDVDEGEYEGKPVNKVVKVQPISDDVLASLGLSS